MARQETPRGGTRAAEEVTVDLEELRSCFDEGCEIVVDAEGRVLGREDRDGAASVQVLSKLRRWYR